MSFDAAEPAILRRFHDNPTRGYRFTFSWEPRIFHRLQSWNLGECNRRTGAVMNLALIPLIRARTLIAKPAKWGQGLRRTYRPHDDSYCVVEAIEQFVPPGPLRKEVIRLVRQGADNPNSLTEWNDCPCRTHAEVLVAFDKAIEAASW
jgi:hypothetical protein